MKVNTPQNISFKGLYNNKLLLKGLKCAQENGSLFSARTSLVLSLVARPIAILNTPKTDKENKKIACIKSIASSIAGYMIMFTASTPIANAVKKIDNSPKKYLSPTTIEHLKGSSKTLVKSKTYCTATQIFKLGTGLVVAVPKSMLTCALIPPLLALICPTTKNKNGSANLNKTPQTLNRQKSSVISFKGIYSGIVENIAKSIGKAIDKKPLQNFAQKIADTNFAQHIMSFTDVLLTASFIQQTKKSKKIKENRKKPLMHNATISTGLCITGGYGINKLWDKPTEKFIAKFKEINKNLPELEKYVEGVKIAKPALILGGIYYIVIPIISTFMADRTSADKSIK